MIHSEAWLAGPLPGISPITMPAAHALIQSRVDLVTHAGMLSIEQAWTEPGGAPSVGFHLRHIAGSIDRLLTYTAGRGLNSEQFRFLSEERIAGEPPTDVTQLITAAQSKIDETLKVIRATPDELLFETRTVGRAQLPTKVIGLLFHIAEHTQRHTGQIIATARIVRGLGI
jgi:uncharacterized damage-inducible protein DinB